MVPQLARVRDIYKKGGFEVCVTNDLNVVGSEFIRSWLAASNKFIYFKQNFVWRTFHSCRGSRHYMLLEASLFL
jgi:hypothetical protein